MALPGIRVLGLGLKRWFPALQASLGYVTVRPLVFQGSLNPKP